MKRKRLGQHLLADRKVLNAILDNANIKKEVVYEVGTGNGILTAELCKRAYRVISCEIDKELFIEAEKRLNYDNLTLLNSDGFKFDDDFDVFVSNLPYSRSREAIEWLATRKFGRGIIMVQKEFAEKILANKGSNYRAVSALAQYCFDMDVLMHVSKESFNPKPKVDSVLLKIIPKERVSVDLIKALKVLFSFKRKKVSSVAKKFNIRDTNIGKRVGQLTPSEAIGLARSIERERLLQAIR